MPHGRSHGARLAGTALWLPLTTIIPSSRVRVAKRSLMILRVGSKGGVQSIGGGEGGRTAQPCAALSPCPFPHAPLYGVPFFPGCQVASSCHVHRTEGGHTRMLFCRGGGADVRSCPRAWWGMLLHTPQQSARWPIKPRHGRLLAAPPSCALRSIRLSLSPKPSWVMLLGCLVC